MSPYLRKRTSRLVSYRRDTELLPNGIVSDAVHARDSSRPAQHLRLHDAETRFNFIGRRTTVSVVHFYWPDDGSEDLRLKALWYHFVAEHASQRTQFGPSCTYACAHFNQQTADTLLLIPVT
ncbi:unnamed protein product [Heligmosomoides polygyrus]|uniref:Tyrosine-protein phosphatase domain-containing protein n=1 Tax=Heligmosomoides polygyrus TaxID=6339 RepID=A0A183GLH6_HELPZ|nr:unnamed protein product [Heligmosomoides polygyrus]